MKNEITGGKVWNISLTNYGEYEYHELSKEELWEILQEEWRQDFNGIFIGRDVDCTGRLGVFFYHDNAYVAYEDFENGDWWCSYNLLACDSADWNEVIRLTPDDTQDYSFIRCSIISKSHALELVQRYLRSGQVEGLYLSGDNGKPNLDDTDQKPPII